MQLASRKYAVDGVLLLDKPTGITSNAAIQRVKRLFSAEKAGHVGTLDPMASGLLPVCLGEATKFSTDTFSADKSYEADVLLGVTTTTGDSEGDVLTRKAVSVNQYQVADVLIRFTGALQQIPPMYSALKRDGKPLYAYAREGVTVERAPRSITIHNIKLLDFTGDRIKLGVRCSKGTYIRVLAEDIGNALGCGASLAGLRRTSVGDFGLQRAVTLDTLERLAAELRTGSLLPVDCLVAGLVAVVLSTEAVSRVVQGQAAQVEAAGGVVGLVRLYAQDGQFVGLGELQPGGRLSPKRLLATTQAANSAAIGQVHQIPKIA
jgi:tRNA pseudouridine55 synthase